MNFTRCNPTGLLFSFPTVTINREPMLSLWRKLHRSNLKAKSKQLRIVLTTLFATKKGECRGKRLGKRRQTTMRRVRKSPKIKQPWLLYFLSIAKAMVYHHDLSCISSPKAYIINQRLYFLPQ